MTDPEFKRLMARIGFEQLSEIPMMLYPGDVKTLIERCYHDLTLTQPTLTRPLGVPVAAEDIQSRSLEVGDGG